MDHHEQHHQHHQQEREKGIEHDKQRERESERSPRKIHPAWFLVLGILLVVLVILTWTLAV
jgi:type VI protein secretion system component VasF